MREIARRRLTPLLLLVAGTMGLVTLVNAGAPAAAPVNPFAPPPPPPQNRLGQTIDVTGNWVAIVSEDWRWRMITPPKGDVSSVPLNPEGRKLANAWDLERDNAEGDRCKAYGAPGLFRIPTRLRITWQDDITLKIETDAGQQTRLMHFPASTAVPETPTRQGYSSALWQKQVQSRGFFGGQGQGRVAPGAGGFMKVETSRLLPGYLRKNGIPFSGDAAVTEYFEKIEDINGDVWLVITNIVDDPKYLNTPFVTSAHFLKEVDGSKWQPSQCETTPPLRGPAAGGPGGFGL